MPSLEAPVRRLEARVRRVERIKAIGAPARVELERMLGRRIHLFLFVKVREDWVDDRERYAALGLDYDV